MTPQPQHPLRCDDLTTGIPGVLWTYSHPWKVFRQDAGMGETEYRLFKDNQFFAQVNSSSDADEIIAWYNASHSSAQQQRIEQVIKELEKIKGKCDAKTSISEEPFHTGERAAFRLVKCWVDEAIALLQAGRK